MTWTAVHERTVTLRAALVAADQRGDGTLPPVQPGGSAGFASSEQLLLALFCCWQTRLLARLDALVEREDGAECDEVADEIAAIARECPGLSAVVAAHLEDPALTMAWRRCAGLVAMATGLPMEVELAGQLRGAVAAVRRQDDREVLAPRASAVGNRPASAWASARLATAR